jgi:hypothetical protein
MSQAIKCNCQSCGSGIEFDKSSLRPGETRAIQCPHCGNPTVISRPSRTFLKIIPAILIPIVCIAALIIGTMGIGLFSAVKVIKADSSQQSPNPSAFDSDEWSKSLTVEQGDVEVSIYPHFSHLPFYET